MLLLGLVGLLTYVDAKRTPKMRFHVAAAVISTVRRLADTQWASSGT